MATLYPNKLLPLTNQTKLTLTVKLPTKLTLERGTNPSKPEYLCAHW